MSRPGDGGDGGHGRRRDPGADPGETLAALNDHVARLFQHADGLLAEWKRYGDSVRGSLDAQLRGMDETVRQAVADSGRAAGTAIGEQISAQVAADLDRAVGDQLAELRNEINKLTETARAASGAAAQPPKGGGTSRTRSAITPTLLALLVANAMLAALLVLSVYDCGRAATAPEPAAIDARAAPDAGATGAIDAPTPDGDAAAAEAAAQAEIGAACEALAKAYDGDAARVLLGVGTARCGDQAEAVQKQLADKLPAAKAKGKDQGKGKGKRRGGGK